jgi:hypothetical protein
MYDYALGGKDNFAIECPASAGKADDQRVGEGARAASSLLSRLGYLVRVTM